MSESLIPQLKSEGIRLWSVRFLQIQSLQSLGHKMMQLSHSILALTRSQVLPVFPHTLWPWPLTLSYRSSSPTFLQSQGQPVMRPPASISLETDLHRDLEKTTLPSIYILKGFCCCCCCILWTYTFSFILLSFCFVFSMEITLSIDT